MEHGLDTSTSTRSAPKSSIHLPNKRQSKTGFICLEKSLLYCANAQFLESFLKRVPELHEPYIPTRKEPQLTSVNCPFCVFLYKRKKKT